MPSTVLALAAVNRRTARLAETVAFYRDAMGLPVVVERPHVTAFWAGDTAAFVVEQADIPEPVITARDQQNLIPVWRCRDVDSVQPRLEAAGARIMQQGETHGSRLTYFLDPSGNLTGLQSRGDHMLRVEDHEANRRWAAGPPHVGGVPALPGDIQGLDWVLLFTRDPQANLAFYRDVLGLPVTDPRASMIWLGETALLGNLPGVSDPGDAATTPNRYALRVADLDLVLAACHAAGRPVVVQKSADEQGERRAIVTDPAGVPVAFIEAGPAARNALEAEAWRRTTSTG